MAAGATRGETVPAPGWVVRPASIEDVRRVVLLATERGIPLIPFGLGSGVCGGIARSKGDQSLGLAAIVAGVVSFFASFGVAALVLG